MSAEEPSPIEIDKQLPHTPETLHTLLEWRVLGIRNVTEMGLLVGAGGHRRRNSRRTFDRSILLEFHSPKILAEATYRAEQSVTARHMTEFTTVDVEWGLFETFQEILEVIENLIQHAVERVWRELSALGATRPVLSGKFLQIPLRELHELSLRQTGQDFRSEKDPSPFEERWICEYFREKMGLRGGVHY